MTALDLIKQTLRVIGALASGETPTDAEAQDALTALNLLLSSWSTESLPVYVETWDSATLTAGTASYSYGTGGDINAARPARVLDAQIRSSDVDYPITIRDARWFWDIASKTSQGRPTDLYYAPTMATGTVYLWPVPDSAYTLRIAAQKIITEFAGLTTAISLPPGYERALKYGLAVELAPEYGLSLAETVVALAAKAKTDLEHLNAHPVTHVRLDVPAVTRRGRWRFEDGYN